MHCIMNKALGRPASCASLQRQHTAQCRDTYTNMSHWHECTAKGCIQSRTSSKHTMLQAQGAVYCWSATDRHYATPQHCPYIVSTNFTATQAMGRDTHT